MGYSRDEKALKPLVSLTLKADGDLTLRSAAVQSMGDLGPMASLDFLQKLALDPTADPELRVATVLVLGGSGAERVRPTLNELARRRDAPPAGSCTPVHSHPWRLRHAAAAAWEQLNRDRVQWSRCSRCPSRHRFAFATRSFCRIRPGPDSLTPPGRVRATQFELHTQARLGTRQDTTTVATHYNRQFVEAGWRQQAGRISTDMAWSEWTFSTMSFPEATVRFQLITYAEAPETHDLELDARWRPLRRLESTRKRKTVRLEDEDEV